MKKPAVLASRGARGIAGRRRGSALFLLLILAVVMATVLGGVFAYIGQNVKAEQRSNARMDGTYAAEFAFEQAYEQFNTLLRQNVTLLPTAEQTSAVTNLTVAPTTRFGSDDGYTWHAFITVPLVDGAPAAAHPTSSGVTVGMQSGSYPYLSIVEFTRTVPNQPPLRMLFHRQWDYTLTPLFQYAIFYNKDMELFPGAAFNVSGRVHSNGRIYTGTTASITFSDFVSHVSGVSNQYKRPEDPRPEQTLNGTITYERRSPTATTRQNPPGDLNADTTDANHNNDGPRELIEIPNSWQSDPNADDRLYNQAGLKVLVNTTTSATTSDSGVSVPANSKVFMTRDGTLIPSTDPLASYLATLVKNGDPSSNAAYKFQDYREGAAFTTTNVDVAAVTAAQAAGGLPQTIPNANKWPNSAPGVLSGATIPAGLRGKTLWNGILYVADLTNSSSHRVGVKLVNGASLPNGSHAGSTVKGLSVVTPNAAFLVGNYNTGGNPPVNSGSNLEANNFVSGYEVMPAAVIADAVTVVSSSWSDSYNASTTLSSRVAANTTINAALISGVVASDGVAYSGGVENYIRLLEHWGNRRLTYYGSMINTYPSAQSTGRWQNTGNYYQAAARNWYFDINFRDPNKLPPGTPVLRSLRKGQWVQVQ